MEDLIIVDCEQNSDEWVNARCGCVTASMFKSVMAKGEGKTRAKYLRQKVAELITGKPTEGYTNSHMDRGHAQEPDARNMAAFMCGYEPVLVGFMKRGMVGCSPDYLVGDDGMGQIKTMLPEILIDVLDSERIPAEHKAQLQGELWVSGRAWTDFIGYSPGLPLFVKRMFRDEVFIAELGREVNSFLTDISALRHSIESRYLGK